MHPKNVLYNSSLQHDQVKWPGKLPVLNCLEEIYLSYLDKAVCSADILIALLQSPNLNKISLTDLQVMSDDVMFNALSSSDCAALSKVIQFSVKRCHLITEAPLVLWITRENCSLDYIGFWECENINTSILKSHALECHRALIIRAEELSHNYYNLY